MLIDFGTKGKMKSLGNTPDIVCPACGKPASMLVLQGYDNLFVLGVPVKEVDQCYFAACPLCAQVFCVEEAAARRFQHGKKSAVTPETLTLPEKGIPHAD